VIGLLLAGILLDLVSIWSGTHELSLLEDLKTGVAVSDADVTLSDRRQAIVGVSQSLLFTITAAAFIAWLYRAYTNLERLGATGLRFSRKWVIGGWFVPILALWRPKQIVNDVWRASDPDLPRENRSWQDDYVPRLFTFWWIAFVVMEWLYNAASRQSLDAAGVSGFQSADRVFLAADLASIVAAVLAIVVVRWTTAQQARRVARHDLVVEESSKPLYRRRSAWATAGALVVALGLQTLLFTAIWRGAIDPAPPAEANPAVPTDEPGILLRDDFATSASGWLVEEGDAFSYGYTGGQYRITMTGKNFERHSFRRLLSPVDGLGVEVTGRVSEGTRADGFGVGCLSDIDAGYFGSVYGDGVYVIVKDQPGKAGPVRIAGGRDRNSVIEPHKETNALRLDCVREADLTTLSLWANGTKLATARDIEPLPPFTLAGMFAASVSGSTDVRFDDMVIREIVVATRR
jgi:hypothetical protein